MVRRSTGIAETAVIRRQRRWSARDRARWLERFERSGLSLRVFCRKHGVPVSTLLFWRRRARQTAGTAAGVLVEVPSAAVNGAAATAGARGIAIRLPNHIELEVSDQTDPSWVAALVRRGTGMLGLSEQTRVFLRPGVTDGRLSFEGLRALAVNVIRQDALAGHLFVFCNRRHNRTRCLCWDGSGFWVATKRLERATFDWPKNDQAVIEMSVPQLRLLLEGFELKRRRGWYRREDKLQTPKIDPELIATRTL